MSSFNGRIIELPGVVVDHFVSGNLRLGKLFFLSHCHKDHMEGITAPEFIEVLQRKNTHLYCSDVTRALLRCDPDCKALSPYLKSLPMEEPVTLSISDSTESVSIVLLPAGHCPGSTMFLFQQGQCNILYTGDFRLSVEDLQRIPALHCGDRVVELDSLYIDTTFCHPNVTRLPSREASRDEILLLMEEWLSESDRHVVQLDCSCFGFEHIFLGVYQKFNMKVHVNQWRYKAYHEIPAVLDCLTTSGQDTRVHACRANKGTRYGKGLPCGAHGSGFSKQHPLVLRIKPSTQWFARHSAKFDQIKVYIVAFHCWRVLHSMHASFGEIRDFVKYLKPKSIVPCVVTPWDSKPIDVIERMKDLVCQSSPSKRSPANQNSRHCSTRKRPCYSDDDIESSPGSGCNVKSSSKPNTAAVQALPRLLASSPEGKKSSLTLSPMRSPLTTKNSGDSEEHNQTSLELSLSEESVYHDSLLQHGDERQLSAKGTSEHPILPPGKTCKSTQTSNETIDLTQSSVFSSDSDVTVCDDNLEMGSQGSSKSWIPATPEPTTPVMTIAFEDI
jgi:DNA cross-link repair 1C protein